jgi:hypothetical protein
MLSMTIFARAGLPIGTVKDLSPIPPELELFARIEGLVGEERDRLREISAELDRIWEKLQERATRLRTKHDSRNTSGES